MIKTIKIIVTFIAFSSCTIRYGFTGADIPAEAKTVSVAYFQNNAALANPNYSQRITEALKDIFISQTRLNLVSNNGDLRYEGSVTGYDIRPVAIQGNETASLNRLTITVNVKYVNTLDTKKNFEQTFSRFVDFNSNQQLSAIEEELMNEVNKQLVQDIFDRSLSNW